MKYTLNDFNKEFDTEENCFNYLIKLKSKEDKTCSKCNKEFKYFNKKDKQFYCSCGNHISPKVNTIFYDSETNLKTWFYVIFQFSNTKNGISAKFIQRQTGVTYKTAWRMCNKIRTIMKENNIKSSNSSIIEIDETYIGGKEDNKHKHKKTKNTQGRSILTKTPIVGYLDRNSNKVNAIVSSDVETHNTKFFRWKFNKKQYSNYWWI